jgi:pimeloyl-ACP methyl ester carboxylesterase
MKKMLGAVVSGLAVGGLVVSAPAQAGEARSPRAATPAAAATSYVPPPVQWGPCEDPTLQDFGAECGMLTVPLDYDHPRGATIRLALSRMRHTTPDSEYQGVMLVNPGGPGGSGEIFSVLQQFVPHGAGLSYDWIGFDPRGVGSSEPSLTCDGSYFGYDRKPYVPTTKAIEQYWLDRTEQYAKDCAAAGGALLDHLKTTDSVADMESIRTALGAKQINYYGFSYGTYLGQVYATQHPDRVRRMVFDANVDPRLIWYDANLKQDPAFERVMGIFFDWVAKHDDVYGLGTSGADVERTYYRVLRQLRSAPQAGGLIGPAEWNDAFVGAGYAVFLWEGTAAAFAAAVNDGDFSGIKELYDSANGAGPGADNGYAVYLAVGCTDAPWPRSWSVWQRDNWRLHERAPFLTWNNAWYNAPCRHWEGDVGRPVQVDGSDVPAILLVGETLDAATPFSGSLEVRSRFPKARLIEGVGGTTHASSLSGIACTDDRIAAYLASGELPPRLSGRRSDVKCDPLPQPDPSAAGAAAAARSGAATALRGMPPALRASLASAAR